MYFQSVTYGLLYNYFTGQNLIQTTIFFILGWFSISFVSWPNLFMNKSQEIKEIENQPRLKKIFTWI